VRHHRSVAYSAEQVLLNKRQIYGGTPKVNWYPEFDHISVNRHCHCACAVSRDLSSERKTGPHFWNTWPKFTYSLCHFHGATM